MHHSLLSGEQNLVAASILAADAGYLTEQSIAARKAGADWIHIDVMDGNFVPPITFGTATVAALRQHLDCTFDVHLMVNSPDEHLEAFASAGADIITVHVETCPHIHRTLQTIKNFGKRCGVAVNPGTPLEHIQPVLELLDLALVMTVNPGWGGQVFLGGQCAKIKTLQQWRKKLKLPFLISVDGGIDPQTSKLAVNAGAQVVAAGSACFTNGANQYAKNIQALRHSLA